jgi:hypothetical protein
MAQLDAGYWLGSVSGAENGCRMGAGGGRFVRQWQGSAHVANELTGAASARPVTALDGHERTIDGLSLGVLLVGEGGRVIMLNAAAESVLAEEDGLLLLNGSLAAARPFEAAMLDRLVASTLKRHIPSSGPAFTVATVSRLSGLPPYLLLVARLEGGLTKGDASEPAALVVVEDPELPNPNLVDEIAVAFAISDGGAETVRQVMESRGLAVAGEHGMTRARAIRAIMSTLIVDGPPRSRSGPQD